jgi:threonyl-tRNA synthetase
MQKKTSSAGPDMDGIRHSLAHILAAAVKEKFPKAQLGIGPVIENGFYYDFKLPKDFSADMLPALQKRMREIVRQNLPFSGKKITPVVAKKMFKDQPFKLDLIKDLVKEKKPMTAYATGDIFVDLCKGGHVKNTKEIDPEGFVLTHTAGAYWKGNEKNAQLTRIYGLSFKNKQQLEAHMFMLEEAKKRDHKKLGPELDLFFIDEKVGKGLPMWTPKGTAIKMELENFTRSLERKYGYEHVCTPYLGSEELYRTSGHLDHYKANMYAPIDMDGDIFYLRPMACPHHIRMYQRKAWSYQQLPVRYAEVADYNRYEKSGELMGMIRVRKFQLTDAHIFVTPEGLKDEFKRVCHLIMEGMKGIGFSDIVSYRFSKRDPKDKEKYYPDNNLWKNAERVMKEALDEVGLTYTEAIGEAAFYGPKLDIQARNANGKEDTLFTAQIDFLLPEKFNIEYTDANGSKKRPVMIHRSAIGSLERTFAFLIEHFAGAFPVWLAPVQVSVLPVGEKFERYGVKVSDALRAAGVRIEANPANESLGKRIRETELMKIPYVLVVGEKEEGEGTVSIRSRGSRDQATMKIEEFVEKISREIKAKA